MLSTWYHTKKYTSRGDISVCLHTAMSLEAAETGLLQKQPKGKACWQQTEHKTVQIYPEKCDLSY